MEDSHFTFSSSNLRFVSVPLPGVGKRVIRSSKCFMKHLRRVRAGASEGEFYLTLDQKILRHSFKQGLTARPEDRLLSLDRC